MRDRDNQSPDYGPGDFFKLGFYAFFGSLVAWGVIILVAIVLGVILAGLGVAIVGEILEDLF